MNRDRRPHALADLDRGRLQQQIRTGSQEARLGQVMRPLVRRFHRRKHHHHAVDHLVEMLHGLP